MWLGIVLYIGHLWFAMAFLLVYALYYERIMFAEEQFLRGKFGQAYLDWSSQVPAFWPALGQWKSPDVGGGWVIPYSNRIPVSVLLTASPEVLVRVR